MFDLQGKAAFVAQWVEVQQPVATFLAASGIPFHDVDDLLQNVAVIAYNRYDEFDPVRGRFLPWVIGIAKNQVLHWRRSAGRDRHLFQPEVVDLLADAAGDQDDRPSVFGQALAWCIEKVRGRARDVLELRYVNDLRPAQIAQRLGTSSSSIRVTLTRTRKQLHDCVERRQRLAQGRPA